jgi:hypothetical protein
MRKRGVRQTSEIDHVGARRPHGYGARDYGIDGQGGRVDDLGEYAHVLTGKIETAAVLSEVSRRSFNSSGLGSNRTPKSALEAVEVSAATTGYQNPIGLHRTWHAAGDDRFGLGAATLTPTSKIDQSNPASSMRARTFSSRGRAR